ncbi:hypothetical protein HELRODRAFT_192394 [Helobdella robusta]|uniref:K Homology domain-containing protein n=1 Tax=Helobdella robusta TaxID=6412 RepID=T1FTW5_HELRO|nr:hypothetical protein HELRODRAFT_192394 [Helobdella robusta]ESO01163.1 hypothetical protein HELRODRAFT_192394 [Helobdella robusta]
MADNSRNRSRSRSNENRRGGNGNAINGNRKFDGGERTELRIIIRAKDAGAVIGKGGENVKRLRQEYKASITVTDSRTPERLIIINADEEGLIGIVTDVGKALFENAKERSRNDLDDLVLKFLIHNSQAGCVIGKAASKLKELKQELKVDLKVFPDCCPRSSERLIRVTGKPDLIAKAMVHILFMLKNWPPKGLIDYYDPSNCDESMIGEYGGYGMDDDDDDDRQRGGRRFQRDRNGGGRRDSYSDRGRDRDIDGRRGGGGYGGRERGRDRDRDFNPRDNYNGVTQLLNSVRTTQQVSIPAELAGVIIGKSGSNIRRIRNETGAEVDLDDAGGGQNDRVITIQGTPEQIAGAQYLLQMSVKQHLAKNS